MQVQPVQQQPTPQQRINRAIYPIYSQLRAEVAKYGDPTPPKAVDYDRSISVPAFNQWVDRQWEKKLAEVRAQREAVSSSSSSSDE